MVDLVARARELLDCYAPQTHCLTSVGELARNWETGIISDEEAAAELGRLGYQTQIGEWPLYFAGLLVALADEWGTGLPVACRVTELVRALDAGKLPDLAETLRPFKVAQNFSLSLDATVTDEERVNRLWERFLAN